MKGKLSTSVPALIKPVNEKSYTGIPAMVGLHVSNLPKYSRNQKRKARQKKTSVTKESEVVRKAEGREAGEPGKVPFDVAKEGKGKSVIIASVCLPYDCLFPIPM